MRVSFLKLILPDSKLNQLQKGHFKMQEKNYTAEQKATALLRKAKQKSQTSNMTPFDELVGVFLGVEPKAHYPKVLDANGNKIRETINGRTQDKRSETSDGWTHSFNELGSGKIIQVVLSQKYELKPLSLYSINGLGYDIKNSNMYFLEKDTKLGQI